MREVFVRVSLMNLILLLLASGPDVVYKKSTAIENIALPYLMDKQRLSVFILIINFCLSVFVAMALSKRCEQNVFMTCFVLKDFDRKRLYMRQKRDLYSYSLAIVSGKLVTDIVFLIFSEGIAAEKLFGIEINFLLCCIIWMEFIYCLMVMGVDGRYCLFFTLGLILVSVLMFMKTERLSFFAYIYFAPSIGDVFIKAGIIFALSVLSFISVKQLDFLN